MILVIERPGRGTSLARLATGWVFFANGAALGRLEEAAAPFAQVESHRSFATARARLCRVRFDLLVTNVRLGAYNGLHLVYLSASGQGSPRSIVFSNERDAALAQEVQRAGAFYEVGTRLPATLAAYVIARLPDYDRRDPGASDRRRPSRGGRRSWDLFRKKAGAGLTATTTSSTQDVARVFRPARIPGPMFN